VNNEPPVDTSDPRWLVSAMVDGETDAAEFGRGCAAWAGADAQVCQSWHAYHLIGDVLRSEDLASPPGRDAAFVGRLRARLDDEPAVLALQVLPTAAPAARRAWAMPAALAAGVMALAAGLVVALNQGAGGASARLAAAPAAPAVVSAGDPAASVPAAAAVAEVAMPGGRLVRDAQLDRYLRAHRDYATASPGSLPGGSGRSVSTVSFER
jgi:sigma-E factor negative regulatory protein RseA